jgi:hypothetical protein
MKDAVQEKIFAQPVELTAVKAEHAPQVMLFNDRSVDAIADTVSVSLFSDVWNRDYHRRLCFNIPAQCHRAGQKGRGRFRAAARHTIAG